MSLDGNTIGALAVLVMIKLDGYPIAAKALSLDNTTVTAILGFLGIVVSACVGLVIATRTSRSEKVSVAQTTLDKTRNEVYESRLKQKDERAEYLQKDLDNLKLDKKLEIEELESDLDKLQAENERLKIENLELKMDNAKLKGL